MTLINNDLNMDDDDRQSLEDMLRVCLAGYRDGQWFNLEELYVALEVQYTRTRDGSLDRIISQSLSEWNWYCKHRGRGILAYVRRDRPTSPVGFALVDGSVEVTTHSWPPYIRPKPSPIEVAQSLAVREKISRIAKLRATTPCG